MTETLDWPKLDNMIRDRFSIFDASYSLQLHQYSQCFIVETKTGKLDMDYHMLVCRTTYGFYKEAYDDMADYIHERVLCNVRPLFIQQMINVVFDKQKLVHGEDVPEKFQHKKFISYLQMQESLFDRTPGQYDLTVDCFFYPNHEFAAEFRKTCETCPNFLSCAIHHMLPENLDCPLADRYLK